MVSITYIFKKVHKYKTEYKGIVVSDLPPGCCTKYNHYTP